MELLTRELALRLVEMSNTNYKLGSQLALIKLGMLTFDSPQDAATHYKRRKEYSLAGGVLGAVAGGMAAGGIGGARYGVPGIAVGGALGAGAGFFGGERGTQYGYDWQHNVGQIANTRIQRNEAQQNVAAGLPSGVY